MAREGTGPLRPLEPAAARFLAIETSSPVGQVAASIGRTLAHEISLNPSNRHGRDLVPAIGALLARLHWRAQDLDVIVVGLGPGSYTGLRVGVTCARLLAYVAGARLIGVNSLAALALSAPPEAGWVAAAGDAQRGDVYTARFQRGAQGFEPVGPVSVEPAATWAQAVPPQAWVVGDALERYGHLLEGRPCRLADRAFWYPTARAVLELGFQACGRGEFADLYQLQPLYLRRPAAVEKWEQQHPSAS